MGPDPVARGDEPFVAQPLEDAADRSSAHAEFLREQSLVQDGARSVLQQADPLADRLVDAGMFETLGLRLAPRRLGRAGAGPVALRSLPDSRAASSRRRSRRGAGRDRVELEQPAVALDPVPDPGPTQAVPHHGLIAAHHGLAGRILDLLQHVDGPDSAAAHEDGVGVRAGRR